MVIAGPVATHTAMASIVTGMIIMNIKNNYMFNEKLFIYLFIFEMLEIKPVWLSLLFSGYNFL